MPVTFEHTRNGARIPHCWDEARFIEIMTIIDKQMPFAKFWSTGECIIWKNIRCGEFEVLKGDVIRAWR